MAEKLVPVAPKIQAASAAWYEDMFPNLNAGVTFTLNCFPSFYRYTIMEIRGMFSLGELCMILDILNGHGAMLLAYQTSPSMVGYHLAFEIEDSFHVYPGSYEEKWKIDDPKGFIERIRTLTMFQKICLELWASAFWEKRHLDELPEKYCEPLLKGNENG